MVRELAAIVLYLDANPDDAAARMQLRNLHKSFWLRAQWFRVFHRMAAYRMRTCNLETGAMNQLAPEGHWRNIALLMADK